MAVTAKMHVSRAARRPASLTNLRCCQAPLPVFGTIPSTRPGKSPSGDACTVDSMDTGNPQRTGVERAGRHRRPTRPGLTRGCAQETERD